MHVSPSVSVFALTLSNALEEHPFFQPTPAQPEGKPRALAHCRKSLEHLSAGRLNELPQASLEYLVRVSRGKDIPPELTDHFLHAFPGLINIRQVLLDKLRYEHYERRIPDKE